MPRRLLIRYWTPEDDAELEGLLRAGKSVTEVAVKLKRSRKTIQSRVRKLQLAASTGRAGAGGEVMSDEIAPLSFQEYLSNRPTRYSPTSAFLRTLIHDGDFAIVTSREELDAYLARRSIAPNGRLHAYAVWKSYLVAKKRHSLALSSQSHAIDRMRR